MTEFDLAIRDGTVCITASTTRCDIGIRDGRIVAIGADADITLWDAPQKVTIRQSLLHQGSDDTPYEGMAVTGWPVQTILRGKTIANDGDIVGDPGFGTHLFRTSSNDRIR